MSLYVSGNRRPVSSVKVANFRVDLRQEMGNHLILGSQRGGECQSLAKCVTAPLNHLIWSLRLQVSFPFWNQVAMGKPPRFVHKVQVVWLTQ